MLPEIEKKKYMVRVLNPNIGYLNRKALRKQILEKAKKNTTCPNCNDLNGTIKKAGLLKIVHEKYKNKKKIDGVVQQKLAEYNNVLEANRELEGILQSGLVHVLNPIEVAEDETYPQLIIHSRFIIYSY